MTNIRAGLSIAFIAATIGIMTSTAEARASACNTTMLSWPWCHMSRPTRPTINYGAPRPPLTPKTNAWCTNSFLYGRWRDGKAANNWGWWQTNKEQIRIRFWPDYYRITFAMIYWDGIAWRQPTDIQYRMSDVVLCDV